MMERLLPCLLVGVGGFVGANARLVVARFTAEVYDGRFPLATFLINVVGSFLLGVLGGVLGRKAGPHGDALRLALGVGFLGAFTTFSTFEYETHALLEDGIWRTATLNVVLSVVLGLIAVRAGLLAARSWF